MAAYFLFNSTLLTILRVIGRMSGLVKLGSGVLAGTAIRCRRICRMCWESLKSGTAVFAFQHSYLNGILRSIELLTSLLSLFQRWGVLCLLFLRIASLKNLETFSCWSGWVWFTSLFWSSNLGKLPVLIWVPLSFSCCKSLWKQLSHPLLSRLPENEELASLWN